MHQTFQSHDWGCVQHDGPCMLCAEMTQKQVIHFSDQARDMTAIKITNIGRDSNTSHPSRSDRCYGVTVDD